MYIKYPIRHWESKEHLRQIAGGTWTPMKDEKGNILHGIMGKHGVRDKKMDGSYIGGDFVRMEPGSSFPLHTHEGDHEIYFIEGSGKAHINGENIPIMAGYLLHIPAEYLHGIWVPKQAPGPLIFVAVGHPHHPIDSTHRMKSLAAS